MNVDNAFYDIVREIRKYNRDMSSNPGGSGSGNNNSNNNDSREKDEADGCCKCAVM